MTAIKRRRVNGHEPLELAKTRRVCERMGAMDLLDHADRAAAGMARAFDDYRRESQRVSLDEIRSALLEMTALRDELEIRWIAANR